MLWSAESRHRFPLALSQIARPQGMHESPHPSYPWDSCRRHAWLVQLAIPHNTPLGPIWGSLTYGGNRSLATSVTNADHLCSGVFVYQLPVAKLCATIGLTHLPVKALDLLNTLLDYQNFAKCLVVHILDIKDLWLRAGRINLVTHLAVYFFQDTTKSAKLGSI